MNMIRFFSRAASSTGTSLLAQLRKSTGFTLSNCREALKVCGNDLAKAEEWLQAEAKRLGWEKAVKLQSRAASQGLIAVTRANNRICMVEVNCETDFVARNEKFVSLAQVVANACINYSIPQSDTNMKKNISQEELGNLLAPSEEKLSDYVAQRIGEFGENIILRRGLIYDADKGINIDVAVHPPITDSRPILTGKYGAFVAYEEMENSPQEVDINSENFGINLCKHIIGANPLSIGKIMEKPSEPISDDENELEIDKDEDGLLNQNYILDPSLTVGELLEGQGIRVVDFVRFECGEDNVKTSMTEKENQGKEGEHRARDI